MKFTLLKNVSEEEAAIILPLLEAHGVPAQIRYSALAETSVVFMGRSAFGNNLCVQEERLGEARELLAEFSKELPPDELEAQAMAAGEDAPQSADPDWHIADYGLKD